MVDVRLLQYIGRMLAFVLDPAYIAFGKFNPVAEYLRICFVWGGQ